MEEGVIIEVNWNEVFWIEFNVSMHLRFLWIFSTKQFEIAKGPKIDILHIDPALSILFSTLNFHINSIYNSRLYIAKILNLILPKYSLKNLHQNVISKEAL